MTNQSKRIKVEIRTIDDGEWQWMGWLDEELLTKLCEEADKLNDQLEEGTDI